MSLLATCSEEFLRRWVDGRAAAVLACRHAYRVHSTFTAVPPGTPCVYCGEPAK